jgi:hypothetical protein
MSNDKEGADTQEIWVSPTQIAKKKESDTATLVHSLCGSCGTTSMYNKDISQNTLSAGTHNDRPSNTPQDGLKLLKPQISQKHPLSSRICFITPCWHVTHNLNWLSFTMGVWAISNVSSNVSSKKCVCKTIMALTPNQLQVKTYHPKANAMIEQWHKVSKCK